ncbi:hypothetical protein GCM10025734_67300 [Kitasatospora paranensis]
MDGGVDVVGVRVQSGEARVVDPDLGAGLGVAVGGGVGGDGAAEAAGRGAVHHPGAGDGGGGVPGDHHLAGGVGAELQVEPAHPGRAEPAGPVLEQRARRGGGGGPREETAPPSPAPVAPASRPRRERVERPSECEALMARQPGGARLNGAPTRA